MAVSTLKAAVRHPKKRPADPAGNADRAWYTHLVLAGLEIKGLSTAQISRATGLSENALRKIKTGKAFFTDRQLTAIENETGLSAGQLALLAFPDADASVTNVIKALSP